MTKKRRIKNSAIFGILLFCSFLAYSHELTIEEVEFKSHSSTLSGSIVFPKNADIHAAVVFVHGSGKQERSIYWAKQFASAGIIALVYDKRGVGQSEGVYESKQSVSEKNINLLADDARAAFLALRKHPKTKDIPVGMTGISQAGWIVPVAAEQTQAVDFIVLWSAPVCKVSEEDIFSKYTADSDNHKIPSYIEAVKARKTKYVWPKFLGKDSNPADNLVNVEVPGLWIFGENDGSVPIDLSIERLKNLTYSGKPFEFVLFSNAGHNNMSQTFSTAVSWIKRLKQ